MLNWKQACLPDHRVSDDLIGLATGEFTASNPSSSLVTEKKNPVSVGIYDEELWWQRDRWERRLWLWGFSLTTMKRMGGKKCVLVWHNKSNGLGRKEWNESGLTESLLWCKRWVFELFTCSQQNTSSFLLRGWQERSEMKKTVISWKKQISRVVWYDWIANMKKRGKLFHITEMGKNKHEILKNNEAFNV